MKTFFDFSSKLRLYSILIATALDFHILVWAQSYLQVCIVLTAHIMTKLKIFRFNDLMNTIYSRGVII